MSHSDPRQPNRIYRIRGPGIGECEITVDQHDYIIDRPQTLRRWRHMTELADYAARQRWEISLRRYDVEEEQRPVKSIESREVKELNS